MAPVAKEKFCKYCGHTKPLSSFDKSQSGRFGVRPYCKSCREKTYSRHSNRTPESIIRNEAERRRKIEGGYNILLAQQGGTCAICNRPPGKQRLYVDHCHKTGVFRGLLCATCNSNLGKWRDSIETLERAADYLRKHRAEEKAGLLPLFKKISTGSILTRVFKNASAANANKNAA